MNSINSIDWLGQLDRAAWEARIRQLRHELRAERDSASHTQSQLKTVEPTADAPKQPTPPSRPVVNT